MTNATRSPLLAALAAVVADDLMRRQHIGALPSTGEPEIVTLDPQKVGRLDDKFAEGAFSLAGETGITEPTVAKVLKLLAQAGLVEGVRGPRGGYRLTRPMASVPLSDIIVAIDGPIALTACVDGGSGMCEAEGICPVRGRWDPVNDAIRKALSGITIADLAGPDHCPAVRATASLAPMLAV